MSYIFGYQREEECVNKIVNKENPYQNGWHCDREFLDQSMLFVSYDSLRNFWVLLFIHNRFDS